MDYQPKPQFVESALKENCPADCSRCPTFPAPFRRIGDSSYCRFTSASYAAGEGITFPGDRMVHILFVMSGSLKLEHASDAVRLVTSKQCVCLARGERYVVTAQDDDTHVVTLSLIHRIEFCEQDLFNKAMPYDSTVPTEAAPVLSMHPAIERLLGELFSVRELADCARYHKMKTTELFMMIKVLYTSTEHAYFFQSMIQPQDNFRVFVCNNYDKAQSVADLAALAGMSLSVFKRRFAEHFNDSVYHWMMRQKALKIFADIRDGEDSTKALMNKYSFHHYTQFSRFCKNYLHATPAQLIASIKKADAPCRRSARPGWGSRPFRRPVPPLRSGPFVFGAGASTCRPFPCPPLLSASVPLPSALVHSCAAYACLPLAVRARPPAARAARPFAPRPAVPLLPAPPFSMLSAPPFCPVPVRPLAARRCFGRFRGGSFRPAAPA